MSIFEHARDDAAAIAAIHAAAVPLRDNDDHAALLDLIGDARFVLLGEASHGTHEFYRERARITRRLIAERGFDAVAIEGDWPAAFRVNRFVRGLGGDRSADAALAGFRRFPTWMWRNREVVDFVAWLRHANAARQPQRRVGFYGLDLYSLHASMAAVIGWLDAHEPRLAHQARARYACFDRFGEEAQVYGLMTGLGEVAGCEGEVVATLLDLQRRRAAAARDERHDDGDEDAFDAEQNARVVRNAEAYYRSMYLSDVSSWNLRDIHMDETLSVLEQHLGRAGRAPRIVVWAHNSHLGDARATEMGQRRGELNLGQLARERHGDAAMLIGFSTHEGSVCAAADWDGEAAQKTVLPARADSWEALMHASARASDVERFMLPLRGAATLRAALGSARLQRAIGVIYRPETERRSHYFFASLADQFDALIHIDRTRAVDPLETTAPHDAEVPETWPAGV